MEDETTAQKAELKLDLAGALKFAHVGIRRAAAFLKLASLIERDRVPVDFSLGGAVEFALWPRPMPDQLRNQVYDEFTAWIVGACLREIESHFSIFLDRLWRVVELANLHGQTIHSSTVIKFDRKFPNNTNSGQKADELAKLVGATIHSDALASLSLARNALTHGIGRVRERDTNHENRVLEVRWRALDFGILDGDEERLFREKPIDMYTVKSEEGAKLFVRMTDRSIRFLVGDQVKLSSHDLAEICRFYWDQAQMLHDGLVTFLKAKGLAEAKSFSPLATP